MESVLNLVQKRLPCRREVFKTMAEYFGQPDEAFPPAVYLFGDSGTGKSAMAKEFLGQCVRLHGDTKFRYVYLSCVECYTTKILLENIMEQLLPEGCGEKTPNKFDSLKEFVDLLQRIQTWPSGIVIVLDNAEKLRDMDENILTSFLRLQELSGLNICLLLIAQVPFEKYFTNSGFTEVIIVHCPQYSKAETQQILGKEFPLVQERLRRRLKQRQSGAQLKKQLAILDEVTPEFFNGFLNLLLSVFYKACRDVAELKMTTRRLFGVYLEPVLDGTVEVADVASLWRHISGPLKVALAQVYLRFESCDLTTPEVAAPSVSANALMDRSVRTLAQSLELPFYGKYLLIAAFLASYNSAKQDKRLFVKHHGKQKKRMQSVNAKAKLSEKFSTSVGPKSFTIDRLLAIFYAIIEDKVGLTCNLLSQISTLVHLQLLCFVSGESNIMEGSARLQCTVSLEFVLYIGRVVGFNVREYLCDFM